MNDEEKARQLVQVQMHSTAAHAICDGLEIVIDARIKPSYPAELFADPETSSLVERRWPEYFPAGGVEMGDSDRAHLD